MQSALVSSYRFQMGMIVLRKKLLILTLNIIVFAGSAKAKNCVEALDELIPYSGGYKEALPPLNSYQHLIAKVTFHNGLLLDERGEALDIPQGGQFILNQEMEFLVSRNPAEADHKRLGRWRGVHFAGYMALEKGKITTIYIKSDSSYKATPESLVSLVYFLEDQGIDVSQAVFHIVREENPEYELSRDILMKKFEN